MAAFSSPVILPQKLKMMFSVDLFYPITQNIGKLLGISPSHFPGQFCFRHRLPRHRWLHHFGCLTRVLSRSSSGWKRRLNHGTSRSAAHDTLD